MDVVEGAPSDIEATIICRTLAAVNVSVFAFHIVEGPAFDENPRGFTEKLLEYLGHFGFSFLMVTILESVLSFIMRRVYGLDHR